MGRRRVSGVATKASFQTRLNPSPMAKVMPAHRPGRDVCAIGDEEGAAGAEVSADVGETDQALPKVRVDRVFSSSNGRYRPAAADRSA